jgi:hypothetical protein
MKGRTEEQKERLTGWTEGWTVEGCGKDADGGAKE